MIIRQRLELSIKARQGEGVAVATPTMGWMGTRRWWQEEADSYKHLIKGVPGVPLSAPL